jgi:integrase
METTMNFKQQAENFISASRTRRRNPISEATVLKYESGLNNHIYPMFGNRDMADINNSALKVLVAKLSQEGLSASTIAGVVSVVKSVVASAVDDQGNELYPRTWNDEFIDLPIIDPKSQKTPVMTQEGVQEALGQAKGQYRALYALLAGTGLRIGEALALTSEDWDREKMTISVTKTAVGTKTQNHPKTPAGVRTVDLTPELNAFLVEVLGDVKGLLFKSSTGGIIPYFVAYRRMKADGIDGAHSLRRFRNTHLRQSSVSEGFIKAQIGHHDQNMTDRYDKIRVDISARKNFAAKAGLGFNL